STIAPKVPGARPNKGQFEHRQTLAPRGFRGMTPVELPKDSAFTGLPGAAPRFTPGFQAGGAKVRRLQDVQKTRVERKDEGGKRTVIEEPDNGLIVKQDTRIFIRHDESSRLATRSNNVKSQRRSDGTTETVIVRPGGVEIVNVVDGGGRLIRRYRRDRG